MNLEQILHRIVARPIVYDLLQRVVGMEGVRARLLPLVHRADGLVLDLGAGTGNSVTLVPSHERYVWLDNDTEKLEGFRRKYPTARAILGDASRIPIRDKSVDTVLCIAVSHHLTDDEFVNFLQEAARVTTRGLVFLDPVKRSGSLVSSLLWKYDRGRYPRTLAALRRIIAQHFHIEFEESCRVYHEYFVCWATPLK